MLKNDYFKISLKEKRYLERGWLLLALGIMTKSTKPDLAEKYKIKTDNYLLYVKINEEWVLIEDYIEGEPLFSIFDKIVLNPGDMECVREKFNTTIGMAIHNALLIEYPYQGFLPYVNQPLTAKEWNKIANNAINLPEVTIEAHHRFENAANMLPCLSLVSVPTFTKKSLITNPAMKAFREKLLEENKDRLHDPSVIADIQKQLSNLNTEYLKDDPSSRFYIDNKSNISLLKLHGMIGAEQDFRDESKVTVMKSSLMDGWTIYDLPVVANNIRGASFNRSRNTALGGYEVKIVARMFQNYKVNNIDCNTDKTAKIFITNNEVNMFDGRYMIVDKKIQLIKKDSLKAYVGKYINIRSPTKCNSKGTTICNVCLGEFLATSSVGIPAIMTLGISTFLSLFMALMHGQTVRTTEFTLDRFS